MSETTLQFAICAIGEEDSDLDAWARPEKGDLVILSFTKCGNKIPSAVGGKHPNQLD